MSMSRSSVSWFAPGWRERINWVQVGKWITFCLLAAAAVMVVSYARSIDWQAVWAALRSYDVADIALAAGVTLTSFALYSSFDLFGRHYVGHAVPTWRVMSITGISYAFNLTLGSIVGAAGMRLRLYQQQGLRAGEVGRIIGISVAINWLGYAAVAGILFVSGMATLPESWDVGRSTLPAIGWGLIAVSGGYIASCILWGDRKFTVRGRMVCLPKAPVALLQVCMAGANWMLMGAVLYCLMQEQVPYTLTLAVVMASSVAGIISRIPGGIGVLEAVSIALMAPHLAESKVVAGVLAYRAVYYLAPLALATAGFLAVEALDRKHEDA